MTAHQFLGGQAVIGNQLDIQGDGIIEGSLTVNGTQAFTGNQTITGSLTVTGSATIGPGLISNGGTHPASSSLNAHISSATVAGNDTAGTITFVSDASGVAQNQTLCLITYNNAALYTTTPIVVLENMSSGADSTTLFSGSYGVLTASATVFSVVLLGHALTASATVIMGYHVIQPKGTS